MDIGPAFIYNVPGRTGQDLTPDIIEPLSQHKNFIGVKECSGNDRITHYEKQGIACWSGNDDESFSARHKYGGHGVISVTSNLVPALMRQLMDNNDETLNQKLQPLMSWLYCQPNPIPLNTILAMTGACQPVLRLPYLPLDVSVRQKGLLILEKFLDQEFVGNKREVIDDSAFVSC